MILFITIWLGTYHIFKLQKVTLCSWFLKSRVANLKCQFQILTSFCPGKIMLIAHSKTCSRKTFDISIINLFKFIGDDRIFFLSYLDIVERFTWFKLKFKGFNISWDFNWKNSFQSLLIFSSPGIARNFTWRWRTTYSN